MRISGRTKWLSHAGALALVAGSIAAAPAARAADAAATPATATQIGEVIVTATRREEKLKDVPVSASVLAGENLAVLGTAGQDVRQLAFTVPSLNIESSNGRTFPRFYIRGYGNTDFNSFASQPVSLIYDDVVQENAALKGFPVFDEADVEVLRGPQGTLFGRNTPAGVVKFASAAPKLGDFNGYFKLSDATYNTANAEAAVNIPVSDKVALRLSLQEQHRDNWVTDPINNTKLEGYDDFAGRLQLLYAPTDDFTALLNVHGRDLKGSARLFRANIIQPGTNHLVAGFDPARIYTDGANSQTFGSVGSNLHLTWKQPGFTLYSVTGFEKILDYFTQGDIDGGNFNGPGVIYFPVETAGGIQDHYQLSQEFRIASDLAGPLSYQAGAFFFYEDVTAFGNDYDNTGSIETDTTVSRQKNDAEAVFGSVSYAVTSAFKLTGGLRFTADHKRFDIVKAVYTAGGALDFPPGVPGTNLPLAGPTTKSADANRLNWDVSGVYSLTPEVNLYARVATGFRAPSFGAPSGTQTIQVAQSEDNTSYEGGVKADLFDRTVRLSLDGFYYDVDHQQLTAVGGTSNQTALLNARKTIGDGVEADIWVHPTPNLTLTAAGSYNHTKIEDPTLAVGVCAQCTVLNTVNGAGNALINGNPLPQAAKWIGDFSLNYTYPVGPSTAAYFFSDIAYRSGVNFFLYESKEFDGPALFQLGLRLGLKMGSGKYDVAVFCRNCTNEVVAIGGIDFDDNTGMINDPRIVGLQFTDRF